MGEPYEKKLGLKSFRPGERRRLYSILVTTFNLDWHLEHLLLPSYACLTDNWWSCLILAMDIEELYFNKYWWSMLKKWKYIYIRWWYWSNIPQVVIIPEARYYRYCSWRQMLLLSCWCQILLLSCWSHILFLSSWS